MISEADETLLEKHRPKLMQHIDLECGCLLAHLRSRRAITPQQEQVIKVNLVLSFLPQIIVDAETYIKHV